MAEIRDDVVLDFQQAIREINRVERLFDEAFSSVDVGFEVAGGVNRIRSQIAGFDAIDLPVDLDVTEARQEVDRLQNEFEQLNLFDTVQDADRLAAELAEADSEASQLQSEISEVGAELNQAEGRARDLDAQLDRAGSRSRGFRDLGANIGFVAAGVATAIGLVRGLAEAFRFLGSAIGAASDTEEALSKVGVVFGPFNDDIQEFAETAPEALGLANRQALEFAGTFGNLFVTMGLGQEAAADMSAEIVQLGADIASFNNINVDEALIKLRAGLVGEFEALRTVGVALNAAVVEQKAFELGLQDVNGEISEAAKVQARYALILEQTGTAQGDYARTADGLANTQRTLSATFEDIRAELGQALVPAFEALLSLAPAVFEAIEGSIPVIAAFSTGVANSAEGVGGLAEALQVLGNVGTVIGGAFGFLEGIAGVVVGPLQALTDVEAGAARTNAALQSIQDTIDNFNVSGLRNGLVNALQDGVDPAVALANALVELTEQGLDSGQIQDVASAFAQIAGVDTGRLRDVAATIRAQGEAFGLEASEIEAVISGLFLLKNAEDQADLREAAGEQIEMAENLRRRALAQEIAAEATAEEAQALSEIRVLADEAGLSIGQFAASNQEAVDAILLLAPPLERARVEMELAADAAGVLAAELEAKLGEPADFPLFESLPEQMGVVTGQIEDETGKMIDVISTSAEDILANIRAQNEAQAEFEANLVTLAASGAGALAERLREEGPGANAAAEDFIANLDLALQAEAELTGTGENNATAYGDAVGETLEGLDFTDPAFAAVLNLAQSLSNPTILASLDDAADAAAARYRNRFLDQITGIGAVDFGAPGAQPTRSRVGGVDAGAVNPQVNLYLDNFTADDVTGAAARAAATAGAVVTGMNSRYGSGFQP